MGLFNKCDKCGIVIGLITENKYLQKKLKEIEKHYLEDVKTLKKQMELERQEFIKSGFIVQDTYISENVVIPYQFETITEYNGTRSSKRETYYQGHFKEDI